MTVIKKYSTQVIFEKMIEKSLTGIYYITLKVPSTVMHFTCFIQASSVRYMTKHKNSSGFHKNTNIELNRTK